MGVVLNSCDVKEIIIVHGEFMGIMSLSKMCSCLWRDNIEVQVGNYQGA